MISDIGIHPRTDDQTHFLFIHASIETTIKQCSFKLFLYFCSFYCLRIDDLCVVCHNFLAVTNLEIKNKNFKIPTVFFLNRHYESLPFPSYRFMSEEWGGVCVYEGEGRLGDEYVRAHLTEINEVRKKVKQYVKQYMSAH